ncbi:polyamine aminopropyltransferase [Bacillus carboniphilus]|uniref:Polyamine aminopropyltransferase n=1 Tax=Bacillus carboniphilus TaxID=86663 RepID=A0ABN0W9R7_9BACI
MENKLPTYLTERDGELWLTEDERENLKISYRIKNVIYSGQSKFQHIMILDSYDFGRMLVLDGVVQTTSIDGHIYNEMITHVPLSIHPNPEKILIIGGGDCGVAKEVCKYDVVKHIDMVEIDDEVVRVCKQELIDVSGNLSDPRVNFIFDDGVAFVKKLHSEYDVIIIDSSDPVGPAEALFEKSFYESLHKALKEDGLMVCQSQSPIFHRDIMRTSYKRIQQLFSYVNLYTAVIPTYPGGLWSFTLGSKKYQEIDFRRIMGRETKYINVEMVQRCFSLPQFIYTLLSDENAQ